MIVGLHLNSMKLNNATLKANLERWKVRLQNFLAHRSTAESNRTFWSVDDVTVLHLGGEEFDSLQTRVVDQFHREQALQLLRCQLLDEQFLQAGVAEVLLLVVLVVLPVLHELELVVVLGEAVEGIGEM